MILCLERKQHCFLKSKIKYSDVFPNPLGIPVWAEIRLGSCLMWEVSSHTAFLWSGAVFSSLHWKELVRLSAIILNDNK